MPEPAVVVEKTRTSETIATLRDAGVYDETRRVRSRGDGENEIPVTEAPPDFEGEVIEQADPEYRVTGLDDVLAGRGWTEEEIKDAPSSWAVVGDVVLVRFPEHCPRREEVGEALLDLQGAETVLDRRGIDGEHRRPDVEVIAGSGETETVHTEHGTKYAMDLAEVMFSPGNKRERVHMGEVVEPGERVLDMFAGIGYFALPMARSGATVTAVERNPTAFRYLIENGRLNDVGDHLRPFRGDCSDVAAALSEADESFERIVMGYYDAFEYLEEAIAVLEPGGILHMHEATPDAELPDRPVDRLEAAGRKADRTVDVLEQRQVKTHSEGVSHVVVEACVN